MSLHQDITPAIRDWLHEPDGLPPPRINEVAPLIHQTPQQRGVLPPLPRRFRMMLNATTYVAASLIVILFGGLLVAGTLRPSQEESVVPAASESTSPSLAIEATTPTPRPTPRATPQRLAIEPFSDGVHFEHVAGDGPVLTWSGFPVVSAYQEVFGTGGGKAASWEGTTVRATDGVYRGPGCRREFPAFEPIEIEVTAADGSSTSSTIARTGFVRSVAVGPAGTLVGVAGDEGNALYCVDGPKDVAAARAELGTDEIDGDGIWYSQDGLGWRASSVRMTPTVDDYFGEIAAAPDGFVGVRHLEDDGRSDRYLVFSRDGITWERLTANDRGTPLQWNGQALVHKDRYLGRATSSGVEDLPLTDEVFGRDGAFAVADASGPGGRLQQRWMHAASELGIVSIDWRKGLLMYSPDGERWSLVRLPEGWRHCMETTGCSRPTSGLRMSPDTLALAVVVEDEDGNLTYDVWLGRLDGAEESAHGRPTTDHES